MLQLFIIQITLSLFIQILLDVSGVYMGIEKPLEHEILTFPNPAKEIINLKVGYI